MFSDDSSESSNDFDFFVKLDNNKKRTDLNHQNYRKRKMLRPSKDVEPDCSTKIPQEDIPAETEDLSKKYSSFHHVVHETSSETESDSQSEPFLQENEDQRNYGKKLLYANSRISVNDFSTLFLALVEKIKIAEDHKDVLLDFMRLYFINYFFYN